MDATEGGSSQLLLTDAAEIFPPVAAEMVVSTEPCELAATDDEKGEVKPGCSNCSMLQKELEECKRDQAFFVDIKRKMILTDTLIQKHQSKCQAFDEQQRRLQEVTMKLAQARRDNKVLEEQLAAALRDIMPWKRDKERFMQDTQENKKEQEDLLTRLRAQQSLIKQYEGKIEQCEEQKAIMESDLLTVKADCDGLKQSLKKSTTSLEKTRDDFTKLKKELSQVRKNHSSANVKWQKAEKRIESLQKLLHRHGIRAPGIRTSASSPARTVYMTDHDSSDQEEEEEPSEESKLSHVLTSKSMPSAPDPLTSRLQSLPPPAASLPPQRRPFPKMDFSSVTCLSPLPPSPEEPQGHGASSSEEDVADGDSDDALTEAASQIEAKLGTLPVSSPGPPDETKPEELQPPSLRVSPRRKTALRTTAPTVKGAPSRTGALAKTSLRSGKELQGDGEETPSHVTRGKLESRRHPSSRETDDSDQVEGQDRPGRRRKGRVNRVSVGQNSQASMRIDLAEEPPGGRFGRRVHKLSSSEDESVKAEERSKFVVSGMKTRSRSKKETGDLQGSSSDAREEAKNENKAKRNDGRSQEYTAMVAAKVSSLSDSSESEDDPTHAAPSKERVQSKDFVKANQEQSPSESPEKSISEKIGRAAEFGGKNDMTEAQAGPSSDSDKDCALRRSRRRKLQTQNAVGNHPKDIASGTEPTHPTDSDEDMQGSAEGKTPPEHSGSSDKTDVSDSRSIPVKGHRVLSKRLTRQSLRKLYRSVSDPKEMLLQEGADRLESTFKEAVQEVLPPIAIAGKSGESAELQRKLILRNVSSPGRLTRSSSHKTILCDNETERDSVVVLPSSRPTGSNTSGTQQPKHNSANSNALSPRKRKVSRKRMLTRSDSNNSEDENNSEHLKARGPADKDAKFTDFSSEGASRTSNRLSSTDGKILTRSETEEFVACMDDVPGIRTESHQTSPEHSAPNTVHAQNEIVTQHPVGKSKKLKLSVSDVPHDGDSRDETSGAGGSERAGPSGLDLPRVMGARQERPEAPASLSSSGKSSPISPIQEPFQGFAYTQPISPMSPERPIERESPVLPAFLFDLPAFPEMVSPLPPSPPSLPQVEGDDVSVEEERDLSRVIPEDQSQPRMISPLFPTPVPFAVSPIPDIQVPQAISPIADLQPPPQEAPVPAPQQSLVGIQPFQIISPAKRSQLPSPRNFHCVAPSDAITVRPQHSNPALCQDKTTAKRSLCDVLSRDDDPQDYRSSFSKKLIARRSSADEQELDTESMSMNESCPSVNSTEATACVITVPNATYSLSSCSSLASHHTQKSDAGQNRYAASGHAEPVPHQLGERREGDASRVDDGGSGDSRGRRDGHVMMKQVAALKSMIPNEFSEHLRRVTGREDVTAFSRVIPHHEESKKLLTSLPRDEHPPHGPFTARIFPEGDQGPRAGADISVAGVEKCNMTESGAIAGEVVREKGRPMDKPVKATAGSIWGKLAKQHQNDCIPEKIYSRPIKMRKKNAVGGKDDGKKLQFKVPPNPPPIESPSAPASHPLKGSLLPQSSGWLQGPSPPASTPQPPPQSGKGSSNQDPPPPPPPPPQIGNQVQGQGYTAPSPQRIAAAGEQGDSRQSAFQEAASSKTVQADIEGAVHKVSGVVKTGMQGAGQGVRNEREMVQANIEGGVAETEVRRGAGQESQTQRKLELENVLTVILSHNPKELCAPVSHCIIEFLQQNSVNLFPAIYAKYIVGNDPSQPIIAPFEEQISKTLLQWTKEKKKKNVMHYLLSELGRRLACPEDSTLQQTLTFCRLFVAVCRESNWLARARLLCYDMVRESVPFSSDLLLAVASVWKEVLRKRDGGVHPVASTMEAVVMHQLQADMTSDDAYKKGNAEKVSACFGHLCGWRGVTDGWQDTHTSWLIGLLRDKHIASFNNSKTQHRLGPRCYEVVKSLELLASSQGWEWTNNQLIIQELWPILKTWSKGLGGPSSDGSEGGEKALEGGGATDVSLATACAVMKVIGDVGQIGLVTHVSSVEQLMKMLIAVLQQPSKSIPWPMQVYTAQAIYHLASSNRRLSAKILAKWASKPSQAVPGKLADQIQKLRQKGKEPVTDGTKEKT